MVGISKQNIVIIMTGASGFVGRNLSDYLNSYTLIEFSRSQLNELEAKEIINTDIIIHLAGKAHDLKSTSNPEEYYQVNFELTKRLYNTFLSSNAQKFIFISSVKAVADNVVGKLHENVDPAPLTHYGKSKLIAEQYIQSQPLSGGKKLYILRPCMIHGPGNKGNLNLLYQFVKKNIPYPLASFENKRSFLSVENLCFVIKELIDQDDIPSGVFNVADDEALSTNELVTLIAEAKGKNANLWKLNKGFVSLIAKLGDHLHLPLNSERLLKLTESYVVDNSKIKKAIGKGFPVSAREGLTKTIHSFN